MFQFINPNMIFYLFFVKTVHPQIELSADTLMWMFLPTLTYFIIQKAFG